MVEASDLCREVELRQSHTRTIHEIIPNLSTADIAVHRGILDNPFMICSFVHMAHLDRTQLCEILMNAPAWARVGLTMRDPRMRERAADALAATIEDRMQPRHHPDPGQLVLPL
jgi:hypothetical protein